MSGYKQQTETGQQAEEYEFRSKGVAVQMRILDQSYSSQLYNTTERNVTSCE